MSSTAVATPITPSFTLTQGPAPLARDFKMYRVSVEGARNVILADYTTAKHRESTVAFLNRLSVDAERLSKRIHGSLLFTRCKTVSYTYTTVVTDSEGFSVKNIHEGDIKWSIPDMREFPAFPVNLLKRAIAAARESNGSIVAIGFRYHNANPKPSAPKSDEIAPSDA